MSEDLVRRIPNTVRLGVAAFLLATAMGISLGVLAAIRRGTWVDSALMVFAHEWASPCPTFWFAYVLILHISACIFPYCRHRGWAASKHMILPTIVLGLYQRRLRSPAMCRSSMLEVISQDFVRTARAKGVSGAQCADQTRLCATG